MLTSIGDVDAKLDRVSITGYLLIPFKDLEDTLEKISTRWQLQPDLKSDTKWWKLTRRISDDVYETVAVLMKNQYRNSWRVDTSNHFKTTEEKDLVIKVINLLGNPHLTRIDIAFDYINCKYAGMRHKLYLPGTTSTTYTKYYGKGGQIETVNVGKRKSTRMFRYYNKLVEQEKAKHRMGPGCKSWERLEVQLRGQKSYEWIANAEKMLDCFKLPEINKLDKVNDRANLIIMLEHPEIFKEFRKGKKGKYRKMYEENQGVNVEYAEVSKEVLKKKIDSIQKEINEFFAEMKIENQV